MLRRAITGIHPSLFHRQCLTHPLLRPPPDFHSPTPWRSFSALPEEEESRSRHASGQSQNPSDPTTSSSVPEGEDEPSATAPIEGEKNTPGAPDDAKPAHANSSNSSPTHPTTRTRTRSRVLRPLLIPPTFPPTLLPITPIFDPPPSSNEQTVETDFSSTVITLASLPPNTNKTDIRPVFQRFGEVVRIFVDPDGRRADVVYGDAHGVKRALHAYAEQPLCVRGQEIDVFRKHAKRGDKESGVDMDATTALRASSSRTSYTRTEQGRDDGAIFVSSFHHNTTQEELSEALASFGKYQRLVMRMSLFAFIIPSRSWVGFSERDSLS
jgi:hypothetical protein